MRVVTVSTDAPEDIAAERHLHGLQARMLSDVQLTVTDAFGLRNTGFHAAPPQATLPSPCRCLPRFLLTATVRFSGWISLRIISGDPILRWSWPLCGRISTRNLPVFLPKIALQWV
ncbi:peroxiredoxin family protein [Luminiphilus sp.]|nr:peroxiredoxin family protein [Luminiphilus sp.]